MELFYEGEWGTVNVVSYAADSAARVACRQVGYPYSDSVDGHFGLGTGPVWMDIILCDDIDVLKIEQCYHLGWRVRRQNGFDLGVRCRGEWVWCACM